MIGVTLLILPLLFLVIAIIYLSIVLYKLRNPAINYVQKVTFPVEIIPSVAGEVKPKKIVLINNTGTENRQDVSDIIYRVYMKEHMQTKVLTYNVNVTSDDRSQIPQPKIVIKSPVLIENKEWSVESTKRIWGLKDKDELLCAQN